jgi:nitrate reductase NapAB chaperone NapD
MPIKSYLAHPQEGKKEDLLMALSKINHCEVIPAQNKDIIVLVTDTKSEIEENILKEKLEAIESLKLFSMVSGFDTQN